MVSRAIRLLTCTTNAKICDGLQRASKENWCEMLHISDSKHKESTDTCDYKTQLLKTRHREASIARRHTASAQRNLPSCLCTWLLPDHMLSQPPSRMKRYLGKCICCPQLAQFWPPICLGGDAWSHLYILIGPCKHVMTCCTRSTAVPIVTVPMCTTLQETLSRHRLT